MKIIVLSIIALFLSLPALAEPQIFYCSITGRAATLELVLDRSQNHLRIIRDLGPFLFEGESATFEGTGARDFKDKKLVSDLRTFFLTVAGVGTTNMQAKLQYYVASACPSCESNQGSSHTFQCIKAQNQKYDPNDYYVYAREPHYPSVHHFKYVMREVGERYWGRYQVTLVTKDTSEFLVINFSQADGISFNGWTKDSGPADFMLSTLKKFLAMKPKVLEEASNEGGKCFLKAFLKTAKLDMSCYEK